jgi:hypothetical protein
VLVDRLYEVRCVLLDEMIAAGLGHYTSAMLRELAVTPEAPLSGLAKRWVEADDAWRDAVAELEARKRYHGGTMLMHRTVKQRWSQYMFSLDTTEHLEPRISTPAQPQTVQDYDKLIAQAELFGLFELAVDLQARRDALMEKAR